MSIPQIASLRERIRSSLWVAPLVGVLLSILLAVAAVLIDEKTADLQIGFPGSTQIAASALSTIAGGMLTITAVTFSITILALQISSQQYSPRVLRNFLQDRAAKIALAAFISTFTYSLLILRQLQLADTGSDSLASDGVPNISVSIAFILAFISIGVLVYYVHHIAQAIRISNLLRSIGKETLNTVMREFPKPSSPLDARTDYDPDCTVPSLNSFDAIINAADSGYIAHVNFEAFRKFAKRHGAKLFLLQRLGTFVPRGAPIVGIENIDATTISIPSSNTLVSVQTERTMQQDAEFGLRQLTDIALRALSPSLNDPTTATQCLDWMYAVMLEMSHRDNPPNKIVASNDEWAVQLPPIRWDQIIQATFLELRQVAPQYPQVVRRMRSLFEELIARAPLTHREVIRAELDELDLAIRATHLSERDLALFMTADARGL